MKSSMWYAMCLSAALSATAGAAFGGTFKTISVLDNDFSDWDDVPVVWTDPSGDGDPIDVATVQIANDDTHLYLRLTYHTAVNPNAWPSMMLAFDTDNNAATGFDIFGLGVVGSDAGFSNDFPFDQRTGFNVGGISAGAAISPYFTVTTSQEYAIARNITYVNDGATVFGESFTLMFWVDGATVSDTSGAISYVFAVPEPTALAGLGLGTLLLLRRRDRA